MDTISNVKMAHNESQEVVVAADVTMKDKKDIDDLELTLAKVEKEKHATENKSNARWTSNGLSPSP